MSEPQFTPGPWHVEAASKYTYWIEQKDATIAKCHSEPDAHLIAAAPDMYEALMRANVFITNGIELGYIRMPDVDSGDSALETPNIIRKALAKAKGDVSV